MIGGFPKGHALVIGAGDDLPYTANDAEGFARLLRDRDRGGYPPSQVNSLINGQATKKGVEEALKNLRTATAPESTLIIYFSGHGKLISYNNQSYYYLCTNGYNPINLARTAISSKELFDLLEAIPAQRILLIFDCC